ncbi:MAG: hypothetical protein ACYSTS_19740 [Planctomycetota bacterium]|jgi:hypothetical protein
MITIKPTQKVECIAYNMKQEKETFSVYILESNIDTMLIKKGTSILIFNKTKGTLTNKSTRLRTYTKARFFIRK